MFNLFSFNMFRFSNVFILLFTIGLLLSLVGCSHKKTNRGHLFRCDWAFEYNRTPWVGCPPDSECGDENNCGGEGCEKCSSNKKGFLDYFKKGSDRECSCENHKKNKGFRRHCGSTSECTAQNPCCRTLGCGMWIDPSDPNSFAGTGNGAKACGLTPFCSPMKPCGLTPNCGRVVNPNYMNQQMLMLGTNGMVLPTGTGTMPSTAVPSTMLPNTPNTPLNTPTVPNTLPNTVPNTLRNSPIMPIPVPPGKTIETPPMYPAPPKTPVLAGPNGLLISMGIVPGVSTITTGGVVAAAGVTTPVGMMTPSGVRLPNGVVNSNVVIKACAIHPGCTAARPCGMTPGCGMMVPVAVVSNNAVQLASALQSPGIAGGIVQAGGISGVIPGGIANNYFAYPMMNQPVNGLTMSGFSQAGYPPIGYAPSGYSRHNRLAAEAGLINTAINTAETADDEDEQESDETESEIKSPMPVPRFHPVPTKPVFQRSEGLPVLPRTGNNKKTTVSGKTTAKTTIDRSTDKLTAGKPASSNSKRIFSEEALNEAMEQAYLEGMSAAMEEVEEELDMRSDELSDELTVRSEELEKTTMQEKILEQAQKLQAKIEKQKELELQIHQDALRKEARRIAAQTAEEEQAIREREIREEAAREMAIREQVIREEAAREMAAQEQAMQAQLAQQAQLWESAGIQQQALMTQTPPQAQIFQTAQTIPNSQTRPIPQTIQQTVQPVNYNRNPATGGKEIIASAVEFLRGNGQRMNPQPPANKIMIPNRNQPLAMNQPMMTNQPMVTNQPVMMSNPVTQQDMRYAIQPNQQRLPQTMPFNNMPNNMPNGVANMMPPNMTSPNMTPMSGFGFLQSAKSTGTNFLSAVTGVMSPFSGLFGSDVPNGRSQGQVISRPVSSGRQVPAGQQIPAGQPVLRSGMVVQQTVAQQPARNIPQAGMLPKNASRISGTPPKIPVPQLSGNSSFQYCPDCQEPLLEHDLSGHRHNNSSNNSLTMSKRIPFPATSKGLEEESEVFIPELPRKPPTKSKTITKPKRIIEADDEEETSMIRQANFVDR
ncbi:MAG: hypothetical protein LBU34_16565 [Planctomycetaceae bacterium]|nr:hypothetical protein [Planctomycetaceae bacterium]